MEEIKIKRKYFRVNDQIKKMMDEINLVPESAGLLVATEKREKITKTFNHYLDSNLPTVEIENKAEWLFLCGKEARARVEIKGEFIVTNNHGDMIGIGKRSERGIKPILDLGDFLRRESNPKKESSTKRGPNTRRN